MGMTETQAPPPQQWLDLLPAWVAVATLLCLPVTVYGLWRIAVRVRAGGGLPLPDGRAFPASRWPRTRVEPANCLYTRRRVR